CLARSVESGSIEFDIRSDLPPGTVFAREEFVRRGKVGDFGTGGIKKQSLAAESKRDGSKVHRVGDWAGQLKIAVAGRASFEGRDPGSIAILTGVGSALGRAWFGKAALRQKGAHLCFGNQSRVFGAETAEDFTLVANKHHSFLGEFLVLGHELLRHEWFDATVIPKDVQGRPIAFGREPESNRACRRERKVVFDSLADVVGNAADMARGGFDADRRIQIEELKNGPEAVVPHVGDRPAPELIPAAEIGVRVVGMIRAVQ